MRAQQRGRRLASVVLSCLSVIRSQFCQPARDLRERLRWKLRFTTSGPRLGSIAKVSRCPRQRLPPPPPPGMNGRGGRWRTR